MSKVWRVNIFLVLTISQSISFASPSNSPRITSLHFTKFNDKDDDDDDDDEELPK